MAQQSNPMHIENSVLMMGQRDLNINHAFETYRDMKMDPIISGSLSWLKAVISKSDFHIVPHDRATVKEKKVAEAIGRSFSEMSFRKKAMVDNILQMLDYGCSLHEVVLKRRADGMVVIGNVSPIQLQNVQRFEYLNGRLDKLIINPAENDGILFVKDQQSEINGDKILHFRLEADPDFPLGRSLLYGCYRPWRTKLIVDEYNTIGAAKNLSTVVQLTMPMEYINDYMNDPASDNAMYAEQMLRQVELLHAGKSSYVVTPSDTQQNGVSLFDVKPLKGDASTYDAEKSIDRYNKEILFALQTQVLNLGHNSQGSFALASNSTSLLGLWLENVFDIMADELLRAVEHCWRANGLNMEKLPKVVFDDIDEEDLVAFAESMSKLVTAGLVKPEDSDNTVIRERFDLPAPQEAENGAE